MLQHAVTHLFELRQRFGDAFVCGRRRRRHRRLHQSGAVFLRRFEFGA
jgi:hypothetical protein